MFYGDWRDCSIMDTDADISLERFMVEFKLVPAVFRQLGTFLSSVEDADSASRMFADMFRACMEHRHVYSDFTLHDVYHDKHDSVSCLSVPACEVPAAACRRIYFASVDGMLHMFTAERTVLPPSGEEGTFLREQCLFGNGKRMECGMIPGVGGIELETAMIREILGI